MKKVVITMTAIALFALPYYGKAQEEKTIKIEKERSVEKTEKGGKTSTEEIVIRKKGEKAFDLKIEIKGDKIIVNDMPLAEFKDDQVTINKRKIIIRDGDGMMAFEMGPGAMNFNEDFAMEWKEKREVIKPFLGVTTEKVSTGAKITEIVKESAAQKAGLKNDDIITKVDDVIIRDGEGLSEAIAAKKPKEVVKITYLRNGKQGSVNATLGERKMPPPMVFAYGQPRAKVRSFSMPKMPGSPNRDIIVEERIGDMDAMAPHGGYDEFQFENSFPRQKRLGLKIQDTEEGGNVKVIDVEEGSAAEKAGLKKEDVITEIGGVKIENTDDARKQLTPSESKAAYTIKAKRGGKDMNFEVKFPKKLKTANL